MLVLARGLSRSLARGLAPSGGMDPEALAFFARASVTDALGKAQVNGFIRGMKALGEWGNVYNAWTLRNYQAGGLSTTLYGLKAGNDGTLTNGPVWGADGITFDGSNDWISIASPAGALRNLSGGHLVCVYQRAATGSHTALAVSNGTNAVQGRASLIANNRGAQGRRLDADSSVTATSGSGDLLRHYAEGRYDWAGNSLVSVIDGVSGSALTFSSGAGSTSNTDPIGIGIGSNANGTSTLMNGTISFAMILQTLPSEAQAKRIRDLYRRTLGAGLGLPIDISDMVDADAAAFATAVPAAMNRSGLDSFYQGLKGLALYTPAIEFWSKLPGQNFGTGTTVKGGKLAYDGTLTNGPTWATNGLTFEPTMKMEASVGTHSQPITRILVCKYNTLPGDSINDILVGSVTGEGGILFQHDKMRIYDSLDGPGPGFGLTADTNWHFFLWVSNGSASYFWVDGNLILGPINTGTTGQNGFRINGAPTFDRGAYQSSAFSMLLSGDHSAKGEGLRALYKSTLGAGLGLA